MQGLVSRCWICLLMFMIHRRIKLWKTLWRMFTGVFLREVLVWIHGCLSKKCLLFYISLIQAGEETGDLRLSHTQLIKYLKWITKCNPKIKKPRIRLFCWWLLLWLLQSWWVCCSRDYRFYQKSGQGTSFYTTALVATSEFFQSYWWRLWHTPVALFLSIALFSKSSEGFAYQRILYFYVFLLWALIRKISIARYSQTFGALFSSGIDVLNCLRAAPVTVTIWRCWRPWCCFGSGSNRFAFGLLHLVLPVSFRRWWRDDWDWWGSPVIWLQF